MSSILRCFIGSRADDCTIGELFDCSSETGRPGISTGLSVNPYLITGTCVLYSVCRCDSLESVSASTSTQSAYPSLTHTDNTSLCTGASRQVSSTYGLYMQLIFSEKSSSGVVELCCVALYMSLSLFIMHVMWGRGSPQSTAWPAMLGAHGTGQSLC